MNPSEFSFVAEHLTSAPFVFAKTMPENPHHYTLKRNWPDPQAFDEVVRLMRQYGYIEHFRGRPYTMLQINGEKYWTMGAPISETILINRKTIMPGELPAFYDRIAESYDSAFASPESLAEDRAVMDLIGDTHGLNVLDIGSGTGLFLRHNVPATYTGIDPSHGMTERLLAEFPEYERSIIVAPFERFYTTRTYDLVISLFGSLNYIEPSFTATIPKLVAPGGRAFLMFFMEDYIPVTYARTGAVVENSTGITAVLPGQVSTIGQFYVVDWRNSA